MSWSPPSSRCGTQLAKGGVLVSFNDAAEVRLRDVDDRDLLRSFTDYAALTLDRGQAMSEREELAVISDRERIARDLHDMRDPATLRDRHAAAGGRDASQGPKSGIWSSGRSSDLDATIRDVRATIFELQTPSAGSVRSELRALVREYRRVLGFTPDLRIKGPVDTAVTEQMREPLLKVLREALSNVSRHAQATQVGDRGQRRETVRFTADRRRRRGRACRCRRHAERTGERAVRAAALGGELRAGDRVAWAARDCGGACR